MTIPPILQKISDRLATEDAVAVLVGGCVRDHYLGLPVKDYDVEVYGLEKIEALEAILEEFGRTKAVGKSFGVLKLIHESGEYDFAFPRKERKIARGHKGFAVETDGSLDFKEAARRRDFTINAMGYLIGEHRFLDPFGGRADLERKILRHIDAGTFVEDPLRVYRGVQFAARFRLQVDPETERLCRRMVAEGMLEELPKERIFEEIKKLLLQASRPSIGFVLMRRLGILDDYPCLLTQGEDRWRQMLERLDMMALLRPADRKKGLTLMLAALCMGCAEASVRAMLACWSDERKLVDGVAALAVHAGEVESIAHDPAHADTRLRKLALEAEIADLIEVARADYLARYPNRHRFEAGEWVAERARSLGVLYHPLPPLVQGRDLIALGMKPSPKFKAILERLYQLQLEGTIRTREEAFTYIERERV